MTDFHKLSSVTSPAIQVAHQDADPANVFPSPLGTQRNGDHFLLRGGIDPGGYQWPPTFSDWLKTVFWQFWQFTISSSFHFRGHFDGLNEGFSGSSQLHGGRRHD